MKMYVAVMIMILGGGVCFAQYVPTESVGRGSDLILSSESSDVYYQNRDRQYEQELWQRKYMQDEMTKSWDSRVKIAEVQALRSA